MNRKHASAVFRLNKYADMSQQGTHTTRDKLDLLKIVPSLEFREQYLLKDYTPTIDSGRVLPAVTLPTALPASFDWYVLITQTTFHDS